MAKTRIYWWNKWTAISIVILLFVLTPVFTIIVKLFDETGEHWNDVVNNLLWNYFTNSVLLLFGVGLLTFVIGVGLAWLVSVYDFPGRKYFEWLLILPLAFPSYMMSYSYVGIMEYTGPLASFLRNQFGISFKGPIIDLMNMPGAIFILSMSFFPYVYVICRASFMQQSGVYREAALLLGSNRFRVFRKVALPLARPAIAGGLALVGMEVLNDYGTVKYLGIDSFTAGIFKAWFSMGDVQTAISLSAILSLMVIFLIWLENFQRGNRSWSAQSKSTKPASRIIPKNGWLLSLICSSTLLISFIFPLLQQFYWVSLTWKKVVDAEFFILIVRSFSLALGAALLIALLSILLLYTNRLSPFKWSKYITKTAATGYAIPGAVIAVGVMIPMMDLDRFLIKISSNNWGMFLSGSLFIVVFAYVVRFLAVGYNSIDAGFQKTGIAVNEAARSLGASSFRTLLKIDLPLIKSSIASGVLLAFVDLLKELPLTLILRPFNFNTLATKAFDMATNEMIAESASACLIVVLTGVIPVILLNGIISNQSKNA